MWLKASHFKSPNVKSRIAYLKSTVSLATTTLYMVSPSSSVITESKYITPLKIACPSLNTWQGWVLVKLVGVESTWLGNEPLGYVAPISYRLPKYSLLLLVGGKANVWDVIPNTLPMSPLSIADISKRNCCSLYTSKSYFSPESLYALNIVAILKSTSWLVS